MRIFVLQEFSGRLYIVQAPTLHLACETLRSELGTDVTASAEITGQLGFVAHYKHTANARAVDATTCPSEAGESSRQKPSRKFVAA
jgi:hypothetical protein